MRCLEQFQLGERYASASFEMKKRVIDSSSYAMICLETIYDMTHSLAFKTFFYEDDRNSTE
jgi:hypothetical protein